MDAREVDNARPQDDLPTLQTRNLPPRFLPTMDPNVTRELLNITAPEGIGPKSVLYRCTCGETSLLDSDNGGICTGCGRAVSAKILQDDLGLSLHLDGGSFQVDPLNQTLPSGTSNSDVLLHAATPATEDPDSLIGQMFGHFQIVSPLGRGGMGQVYQALDTSLQRYVAVKLLRSGLASGSLTGNATSTKSSDREIDKLLQEAISQARVSHPNIATIYYVGKQDGNPFLAMELVNGGPLSDRIVEAGMPFDEIGSVAMQLAEALQYSFDRDIIHGDIKPSNVLISKNGIAKLSDFGMARSASNNTDPTLGGTPNYIAPELLKGGKPTVPSDIYALGVTLFEMTFGHVPKKLTGVTVADWVDVHDHTEIEYPSPWPSHLPERWQTILKKMLATNPDQRHQSYDELIADFKRLRPISKVMARIFPRLIAAGLDWVSVLSLAIVFQVVLGFAAWEQMLDAHPVVTSLLNICNFLPIIAFTILIYFWRQSVGRSLMHIRVVNQYGLRPTGSQMVIRSFLRMQFPWVIVVLRQFTMQTPTWFQFSLAVLFVISLLVLIVDICFMMFFRQGRSVHDLVAGTHVVLDAEL